MTVRLENTLPLMSACEGGMYRIPPQLSFWASQITHFQISQGQKVFFTWIHLDVSQISRPLGINDDRFNVFLFSQQNSLLKTEVLFDTFQDSKQKYHLAYLVILSIYFSLHYSLVFIITFCQHVIHSSPHWLSSTLPPIFLAFTVHSFKTLCKAFCERLQQAPFHDYNLQNTKSVEK